MMKSLIKTRSLIGCSINYIAILLYISYFFTSCTVPKDSNSEMLARDTLNIDVTNILEFINLDNYLSSIEIIPLEESDSFPIGAITKVIQVYDYFVIVDREITFKAFVFDKEGKYIKNLVETGEGPGECFQINDCWINNDGNLQALDYASRQIFTFDRNLDLAEYFKYSDNRFLSVSSIPESDMYIAASQYNFANNMDKGQEYLLALLDTNFEFTKGYFPIPDDMSGATIMMGDGNFFQTNDKVTKYFRTFENNIYNVDSKGEIFIDYHLKYSKKALDRNTFYNLVRKAGNNASFSTNKELFSYSFFYSSWSDMNQYISLYSIADSKRFFTLYDKKNKKIINAYNIKATIENMDVVLPNLRFKNGNMGYAVLNTIDEGVMETDLYDNFLKELPEGTFVLIKLIFKD